MNVELTFAEKIKIILGRKGMNITDLANLMETSPQNLHNKMKRNNFNEKEMKAIAKALNCEIEINFITEDGNKI